MIYDNWEWPQWLFVSVFALSILANTYLHGTEKSGKYSGPGSIIGAVISIWILYMGGFWS